MTLRLSLIHIYPDGIYQHLSNYGMLERLDVGLDGVATPTIIRPEDKSYGTSTIPGISRGYGVSVPAINTLNFYNAVANGGRVLSPYLVDRVEDAEGKVIQEFQPQVLHELSLIHISLTRESTLTRPL